MSRSPIFRVLGMVLLFVTTGPVGEVAHGQGEGYWHTSGSEIVDTNGHPVRIAGINW